MFSVVQLERHEGVLVQVLGVVAENEVRSVSETLEVDLATGELGNKRVTVELEL